MSMNGERTTPIDTPTGKMELAEALEKSRAAFALVDAMWDEVKTCRAIADAARQAANRAADKAGECLAAIQRKSLPPMRGPLDSQVMEFIGAIKEAAVRGEKDPNSTPEKEIEPILETLLERRTGRRVVQFVTWVVGIAVTAFISAEITLLIAAHH